MSAGAGAAGWPAGAAGWPCAVAVLLPLAWSDDYTTTTARPGSSSSACSR